MTKIGIPKEIHPGEKRVAATPQTILKLRKLGFDVSVQSGAGDANQFRAMPSIRRRSRDRS
jgi:NAD(P) transhydrogenase subunit alpha